MNGIDYLADTLGLSRESVIEAVNRLRQEKLLADSQDMSAYIKRSDSENKSMKILERYAQLEQMLLNLMTDEPLTLRGRNSHEYEFCADYLRRFRPAGRV